MLAREQYVRSGGLEHSEHSVNSASRWAGTRASGDNDKANETLDSPPGSPSTEHLHPSHPLHSLAENERHRAAKAQRIFRSSITLDHLKEQYDAEHKKNNIDPRWVIDANDVNRVPNFPQLYENRNAYLMNRAQSQTGHVNLNEEDANQQQEVPEYGQRYHSSLDVVYYPEEARRQDLEKGEKPKNRHHSCDGLRQMREFGHGYEMNFEDFQGGDQGVKMPPQRQDPRVVGGRSVATNAYSVRERARSSEERARSVPAGGEDQVAGGPAALAAFSEEQTRYAEVSEEQTRYGYGGAKSVVVRGVTVAPPSERGFFSVGLPDEVWVKKTCQVW